MRSEKRTVTVWVWEREGKRDVEIIHRPNDRQAICRTCGGVVEPGAGHVFSPGRGAAIVWHTKCFLESQSQKYPEKAAAEPKRTKATKAKAKANGSSTNGTSLPKELAGVSPETLAAIANLLKG